MAGKTNPLQSLAASKSNGDFATVNRRGVFERRSHSPFEPVNLELC